MKKWLFAVGLILLFVGIIFMFNSETIWEEVKTETDKRQISSNFTEGDKVKLIVYPASDWKNFLEPKVIGVPYLHKFVYVNITDPYGSTSMFEITFALPPGYTNLYIYNVTLISSNGFSAQGYEDLLQKENTIVGKITYTGQYTAWLTGALPPGGSPASKLIFFKEKEVITIGNPHSRYFYPAVVMLSLGVIISFWGAKAPKRRVLHRRRSHTMQKTWMKSRKIS